MGNSKVVFLLPKFGKRFTIRLMADCVFCKIVAGEIPAEIIAQDSEFLAFLSITPVYPGFTLVVTKEHFGSYAYATLPEEKLTRLHLFAKKVALAIDKALGSERCVQVMEGLDVDHVHLKLFPKYPGVTHAIMERQIPMENFEELKRVAQKIREGAEQI